MSLPLVQTQDHADVNVAYWATASLLLKLSDTWSTETLVPAPHGTKASRASRCCTRYTSHKSWDSLRFIDSWLRLVAVAVVVDFVVVLCVWICHTIFGDSECAHIVTHCMRAETLQDWADMRNTRCSIQCRFPHFPVLHFPPLDIFPALSSPAFSTSAHWSRIFQSCIFYPCILFPHFPVLPFPPLQSCAAFSSPAFSGLAFSASPKWHRFRCGCFDWDSASLGWEGHFILLETRLLACCLSRCSVSV